ncbi:hypothetical protein SUGI_0922490 [Cryptomeria japonica]|nr:hypothetical protein SUGI_0922490 [Cryptomeria japonica]
MGFQVDPGYGHPSRVPPVDVPHDMSSSRVSRVVQPITGATGRAFLAGSMNNCWPALFGVKPTRKSSFPPVSVTCDKKPKLVDTEAHNKKEYIVNQKGPDGNHEINKENNVQPSQNSEMIEMDQDEDNRESIHEDQNLEVKDMDQKIISKEDPIQDEEEIAKGNMVVVKEEEQELVDELEDENFHPRTIDSRIWKNVPSKTGNILCVTYQILLHKRINALYQKFVDLACTQPLLHGNVGQSRWA